MLIRCWGARGSIPVSGPHYIRHGGDTTCLEIRSENNQVVIVDAGNGIRRLGKKLLDEGFRNFPVLFTHAHWDHILGFPFFRPVFRDDCTIKIFCCPEHQADMEKLLASTMQPPYFPVPYTVIKSRVEYRHTCNGSHMFDTIETTSIPLSHPNKGLGYRFMENGKSFVFLTDNELGYVHPGGKEYGDYLEFSKGADLLVHDAEFKPEEYEKTRTWGHSTYVDALNLAIEAGVARFGLFHHNQDRTDDDLDAIVDDCRSIVAKRCVDIDVFAMSQDMEIVL